MIRGEVLEANKLQTNWRQGDGFLLMLFDLALEKVIRTLYENGGMHVRMDYKTLGYR